MSESVFTPELKKKADHILSKYETKRATLLEILRLVMEEHGHVSLEAEEAVADYLEISPVDVHEVVTFYTLYYREPKARARVNICRTLSCALLGAGDLTRYLEEKMGVKSGEKREDGECSLQEVECLGACELAPVMQVNDDEYLGLLDRKKIDQLLAKLNIKASGKAS